MKQIEKKRPFILLDETERKTISETINLYGRKAQILKMSEEAAELSAATSRFLNSESTETLVALVSEIADVQIMIYQFLEINDVGVKVENVNDKIEMKLTRLAKRNEKEIEIRQHLQKEI